MPAFTSSNCLTLKFRNEYFLGEKGSGIGSLFKYSKAI